MANRNARNLLSLRLQRSDKYSHSVDYLQKNFGINKESLSIVGFDVSGGLEIFKLFHVFILIMMVL